MGGTDEEEGSPASDKNTTVMIQAQNDLYMVVEDSLSNSKGDNTLEGIHTGKISRGELVRNAANICRVLMKKDIFKGECYENHCQGYAV